MEKLHSQLPQPLKRCSPSRHNDLLTQIKNSNSPVSNRSPARRIATSSPNNIRSRDPGAATLTSKQPEVKVRSTEVVRTPATPTRRSKYSPAANGNMSPTARGKISLQRNAGETTVSDSKQSAVKAVAARLPVKVRSAQLRTLRSPAESVSNQPSDLDSCNKDKTVAETAPLWVQHHQSTSSAISLVSSIKKSLSPKFERRGDVKKVEQPDDDDKNNGGGGSPIYHELDPPGTCHFPVQHTYQSIVEISDELESLRSAASGGDQCGSVGDGHLSRARSAQELTQKSPTKLSLFSRFRFTSKKSSTKATGKAEGVVRPPAVRGQSSLQDVDLITRSRDEVCLASTHDRQPSFSTFTYRMNPAASCDDDGYSSVYVPQNPTPPQHGISVTPRTTSLGPLPHPTVPAPEPLYRQKFLKIASVHTLQSSSSAADGPCLTSSNSVGDLLLTTTDVGHQSPIRVTSYDDHALATGSRKMAAPGRLQANSRSYIGRFALSPGRGAAFASPSCGIRMAEMRGAVRRCTGDGSTSPTRSPSASTPVPSPAPLSVFQFSVPPPGVMMSPPVQRAYRHVSSQTVTTVRPPSASCVLSVTAVHEPAGQMQTIEEEEDSNNEDAHANSAAAERRDDNVDQPRRIAFQTDGADTDNVAGQKPAEDGSGAADGGTDRRTAADQTSSETTSAVSKTSRLRRPSPIVAAKPLSHGCGSPLPEPPPSSIASMAVHRRAESSSVSPPSTPRSTDSSQSRPGSARAELVRRPFTRGQQQQRPRQADGDSTTTGGHLVDGLLVSGACRAYPRRLLTPADWSGSATASPNVSSGSSLSLLSSGSDVDVLAGTSPPEPAPDTASSQSRTSSDSRPAIHQQHKHSASSSVASRVGRFNELTVPTRTDRANY